MQSQPKRHALLKSSTLDQPLPRVRQNVIHDFGHTAACRIDVHRVGCRPKRRHPAARVALISLRDVRRKGRKANIHPLCFQLLMTALSPFLGAGREKDFQLGLRKDDAPHGP